MKGDELSRVLSSVAVDVFGASDFFVSDRDAPSECFGNSNPASSLRYSIAFNGPEKGRVDFDATARAIKTLSSISNTGGESDGDTRYSEDDDFDDLSDDDEDGHVADLSRDELDSFCRLLNRICGNLISRIYGPEPIFDVGPPCRVDTGASLTARHDCRLLIDVEGSPVTVSICLGNQSEIGS